MGLIVRHYRTAAHELLQRLDGNLGTARTTPPLPPPPPAPRRSVNRTTGHLLACVSRRARGAILAGVKTIPA